MNEVSGPDEGRPGSSSGGGVRERSPWRVSVRARLGALQGAILAVVLVAAACGISATEPQAMPQEGHEDLLLGTSTTSTTTPPDGDRIRLFFIGEADKLESVLRTYEERPPVKTVLADLEENPRDEEQTFGDFGPIQTFVPLGLEATLMSRDAVDTAPGIRVISVDPEADLRGRVETDTRVARLIVRQLVCTFLHLTLVDDGDGDSEDVTGVEIFDNLGPIPLTDDDGQLLNRPAVLEDFGNCKTGTEEREELLDEAEETTSTTSATTSSAAASPTTAE